MVQLQFHFSIATHLPHALCQHGTYKLMPAPRLPLLKLLTPPEWREIFNNPSSNLSNISHISPNNCDQPLLSHPSHGYSALARPYHMSFPAESGTPLGPPKKVSPCSRFSQTWDSPEAPTGLNLALNGHGWSLMAPNYKTESTFGTKSPTKEL